MTWRPSSVVRSLFVVITLLTLMEYLCHRWHWVSSAYRSQNPFCSLFMISHWIWQIIRRLTQGTSRRMPLVKLDLLILPKHLICPWFWRVVLFNFYISMKDLVILVCLFLLSVVSYSRISNECFSLYLVLSQSQLIGDKSSIQ